MMAVVNIASESLHQKQETYSFSERGGRNENSFFYLHDEEQWNGHIGHSSVVYHNSKFPNEAFTFPCFSNFVAAKIYLCHLGYLT